MILLVFLAVKLGQWQFHRLDDRKEKNTQIRTNEKHEPTEISEVVEPGGTVTQTDEWRLVTATGTYRTEDQIIVRYRTRAGKSGVDVMVPLETSSGVSVLVDRGWLETDNRGEAAPDDVPAPPSGEVTMTGWLRIDATGAATAVRDQTTRAPNSAAIAKALGIRTYPGFVDMKSESPQAAVALEPVELPELNNGPHFFYGLQWWFFGALAVFGFFYLLHDERRQRRREAAGLTRAPRRLGRGED